ncbi:putative DNA oxidative demethylase [Helianthus annuus]|nr:putative DNA oxidative demethylase [Helianthus annuus]
MQDAYYGTLLREYHNIPFAKGCCTEIGTETVTFRLTNRDRTPDEPSTFKILGPGMIILKNYLSLKDQVDIVKLCDKMTFGLRGYYMYKSDVDCRRQMCFGRNWAPETRYKNRYMSNGMEPLPIPDELISLAEAAIQDAQIHLDQLPSMRPDTCLANFYQSEGRLGLHQDDDESPDSLERGLPVVSISIGDMAEFVYGHTPDKKELKSVMLKSGDVLIFGGKSRLIYHGVTQIYLYTSPEPLIEESGLRPGRLSLTLRQF